MSAGHTGGRGTPDEGDDPFGYLYRPEAGQPQPQAAPRQPSYHQVRPVGERTFGGQQGYRQPQTQTHQAQQGHPSRQPHQQSPDAYYAAPETQPGGPPYSGPPDRRRQDSEPRRNGLLIGAIAVVLAVVVGVGAAIIFSSGGEDGSEAGGDPSASATEDSGDDGGNGDPGDEPTDEQTEPEGLPAATITDVQLGGGITFASDVPGAETENGAYIAVGGTQNSTVTWTFDFEGEPGQYRLYTGYAAIADGQTMAFSVNNTPREDPVELRDYNGGESAWESSWFETYNIVELAEGSNTVQFTCTAQCDVLINKLEIRENRDQ
ncbi:hypothetical protein [Streptomyces sp. SBT349]|uniref:hypothetical protein n=1 Tax=Streptomyces sp. SBT349 TaxID=1580539 RepID=UPI00066C8370|nr:hypothetical protein [Streptomyces sp. SBT349]